MTNLDYDKVLKSIVSNELKSDQVVLTEEYLLKSAQNMTNRGYVLDKNSLDALSAYIRGYGIIIGGDVGTGKTFFFETVNRSPITVFNILRWSSVKLEAIDEWMRDYRDTEILVDDIGNEPIYNNYGCKIDLLPWIIEDRLCSSKRTHFTTNLNSEQLKDRYGARVCDRLFELCKPFKFCGKSKRQTKVNKEVVYESTVKRTFNWILCQERCANCTGNGCSKGVSVPPSCASRPYPPEECEFFKKGA